MTERMIAIKAADLPAPARGGFFPPDLERWAYWRIDATDYTLVAGRAEWYYVDLEDCLTSAATLDWIFQIAGKTWATPDVMAGLIAALDWLLRPQANLCSFGADRKVTKQWIRNRVKAAVKAFPETGAAR